MVDLIHKHKDSRFFWSCVVCSPIILALLLLIGDALLDLDVLGGLDLDARGEHADAARLELVDHRVVVQLIAEVFAPWEVDPHELPTQGLARWAWESASGL